MAPAYEYYWPSNQHLNQVLIDHERINVGPAVKLVSDNPPGNRDQHQEKINNKLEDSRSSRIRNLVPRPMRRLAASETHARRRVSLNTRALRRDLRTEKRRTKKRKREKSAKDYGADEEEEVEMTLGLEDGKRNEPGEQNDVTTNESNARGSESESDDSPEDEQISVNLKMANDNNVEERSDKPRRVKSYSPVYPPGDLDILYSDALLVYVKDFNNFIKR